MSQVDALLIFNHFNDQALAVPHGASPVAPTALADPLFVSQLRPIEKPVFQVVATEPLGPVRPRLEKQSQLDWQPAEFTQLVDVAVQDNPWEDRSRPRRLGIAREEWPWESVRNALLDSIAEAVVVARKISNRVSALVSKYL